MTEISAGPNIQQRQDRSWGRSPGLFVAAGRVRVGCVLRNPTLLLRKRSQEKVRGLLKSCSEQTVELGFERRREAGSLGPQIQLAPPVAPGVPLRPGNNVDPFTAEAVGELPHGSSPADSARRSVTREGTNPLS